MTDRLPFSLNTASGYLHTSDHAEGDNVTDFARADEADLFADRNDLEIKFCKQCFPGNANITAEEDEAVLAETAVASRDNVPAPESTTPASGDSDED